MTGELDDVKRYYQSDRSRGQVEDCIEIKHPAITTRYLTTRQTSFAGQAGPSGAATFRPWPFAFSLPPKDSSGASRLRLTLSLDEEGTILDDVDAIMAYRVATKPVHVQIRVLTFLLSGPANGPNGSYPYAADPITLYAPRLSVTDDAITLEAGFRDLINRSFPRMRYTRDLFPGLVRA